MPPKGVTLAAFLPSQLKPSEQGPEPAQIPSGQPRPHRCRCEGPFDLCWRYPANIPNAVCKSTWDRLLAPFQFKGREWTIVELRSLWPHTVQALNERLMKGRMERTLKDDLQDDLQVLVDLIQYSCKPHPRPPRAGMKTLIVQGRILAEAIAQDALFQLDPADPSAPRPDRDLVDLINRLRDHHPHSLLAPALHVLRTLGNTAVHLDRDSARLADSEIGDAAAVCCRLVVLVMDAYMHMCANLHRHEETQEALAQPLVEAPVAPIPAPNVLLRQRDPSPAAAQTPAAGDAAAASSPVAPTAALAPPRSALHVSHSERVLLCRTAGTSGGGGGGGSAVDGGGEAAVLPAPPSGGNGDVAALSGARRRSSGSGSGSGGGGGGRHSCAGSADGSGRVPYSPVSCDWSAAVAAGQHPPLLALAAGSVAASPVEPTLTPQRRLSPSGSRGWWPHVQMTGAPVAPLLPTPSTLLRRTETGGCAGQAQGSQSGPSQEAEPTAAAAAAARPPQPSTASSVSSWVQGHPVPYGLPGPFCSASGGSGGDSSSGGGGGGAAAIPPTHFGRLSSGSSSGGGGGGGVAGSYFTPAYNPTAPSIPSGGAACVPASAGSAFTAVVATASCAGAAGFAQLPTDQTDPWVGGGALHSTAALHCDGSSPRRCPMAHSDVSGNGNGYPQNHLQSSFSWGVSARGSSPPPSHCGQSPPCRPANTPTPPDGKRQTPSQPLQQPIQLPLEQQSQQSNGAGPAVHGLGPGPGPGSVPGSGSAPSPSEASRRLLQLCATAQPPPAARVERLLQAGASLGFTDKSGMTALHLACYWPHEGAARLMLAAQPSAAGAADREGRTPLWVAAQRGHTGLVEMLLTELPEGAAQVDVANAAGVTPLRVAAAQGHAGVVEALLRAGANAEAADKDGFTPLYVAAARCQLEVVRLLLGARATADRADRGGRTPLWAALHPGGAAKAEAPPERRAGVVRLLLGAGADVYLLPDSRDRDYCWQLLAQSIAAGE